MPTYSDTLIRDVLNRVRSIAIVGVSADPVRPSHIVAKYLSAKGYRIFAVNPGLAGKAIFGEQAVASLNELAWRIDMVDVFRRPDQVPPIADDAIRIGAKVLWLQLGIVNEEARQKAEAAGLTVIMDRCPKIEFGRLSGENGWLGIASQIVSAKPPSILGPRR